MRDVGAGHPRTLCSSRRAVIGVRGPFGTDWGVEDSRQATTSSSSQAASGSPRLRGAVFALLDAMRRRRRAARGGVSDQSAGVVLIGARTPDQIIFTDDLEAWRRRAPRCT